MSEQEKFKKWWVDFTDAHEEWRYADSEALRLAAWQAGRAELEKELSQQKPVGDFMLFANKWVQVDNTSFTGPEKGIPLWTMPAPQQKPLSAKQLDAVCKASIGMSVYDADLDLPISVGTFARAIEAAHGITK